MRGQGIGSKYVDKACKAFLTIGRQAFGLIHRPNAVNLYQELAVT